jgi:hypothetical protein
MKFFDKLTWAFFRWKSMIHPWEEFYRVKQIFQLFIIDYLESRNGIEKPSNFIFNDKSDVRYTMEGLQQYFDANQKWENFSFYDVCIENIQMFSEWRKDPKSNISSDLKFSPKIGNQNFDKVGDYRYVSVMSRFHHFPFFAILALKDETLVKTISQQLSDWNEQNPYLQSIHWKSGIEAGIRVTSLVMTRKIIALLPKSEATSSFLELIDETAYKHYNFLKKHLSLYSSANNHLIAELLGLCTICSHYDFPSAEKEAKTYYNFILKSYLEQSYIDGFSKEQSIHYHAEVLGMLAITLNYVKDKRRQFVSYNEVLERFSRGIEILQYFISWSSEMPHIGDSDDGQLIFPYADKDFNLYESLVIDNHLIQGNLSNKIGIRNYLNSGEVIFKDSKEAPVVFEPKTALFKESGYCFFYKNNKHLIFDIGDLGLNPLAAHGHSDALQILVAYNNEPFIIDSGTYQYHARYEKWRKYFRSAIAHNTVTVKEKDQSRQVGRMNWMGNYEAKYKNFEIDSTSIICSATHNGFLRQGLNIKHYRTVSLDTTQDVFEIIDTIDTKLAVTINFNLHIAPQIIPRLEGNILILQGEKGIVILENSFFRNALLTKGEEKTEIRGWYSPNFSNKKPIYTLNFSKEINDKTLIKTRIIFKNIEA